MNTVVSILLTNTFWSSIPEFDADVQKLTDLDQKLFCTHQLLKIFMKENLLHSLLFDGLENQMEGKFRPGHLTGALL
jgi:hypothetical protein